ncbi:MAG: hypothetical protein FWD50_08780 [Betaproteobacteria bacterium]|nr:hypothetical protein [Betaproteobacteria bacterium]
MNEPRTFRAGDSVSWTETLAEYPPADGWSLDYRLLWSSGTAVDIPSTAAGDEHVVSVQSASTAAWPAGRATLVWFARRAGERITVGNKQVNILPDLAAAQSFDGRTANRRALDQAEAAMAAYLEGGKAHVAEYVVGSRTMKFRSVDEIVALINHYKRLVAKENSALAMLEDGGMPGRVYYRG